VFSPACKALINAVATEYRYKTRKNGELEETPEKKHPVSDLADALQYAVMGSAGNVLGRVMRFVNRQRHPVAAPPVRGWT
ncbi:hypothetical protein LPK64_29160, partial [Klebsiella pneumoniae]|nr:hypothetical protein [Klebsiella pneumoniae]